jgi:hypothetical protein
MDEFGFLLPAFEIVDELAYWFIIEKSAFVLQNGCARVIFLPWPLLSPLRIGFVHLCAQL